jgi:hypothetical protein
VRVRESRQNAVLYMLMDVSRSVTTCTHGSLILHCYSKVLFGNSCGVSDPSVSRCRERSFHYRNVELSARRIIPLRLKVPCIASEAFHCLGASFVRIMLKWRGPVKIILPLKKRADIEISSTILRNLRVQLPCR